MPLYTYRRSICGEEFDAHVKLGDFTRYLPCKCIGMAVLQMTPVQGDVWEPYYDRMQCREFKTKRQFKTFCSENGCHQVTSKEAKIAREEARYEASLAKKKGERQ